MRSQAQWTLHWMSEEILFWSCVSLVPRWETGHVGEGGVYHTPTVPGCLVEKREAKKQVHRLSNLSFPCLTLSQSPNYAIMLPEQVAWRDMILLFLCFLPFRLRIVQLKKRKKGCFNKSEWSSKASYLLRESVMTVRKDFLSAGEMHRKKRHTLHIHLCICTNMHIMSLFSYLHAHKNTHLPSFLSRG